MTLRSGLWGFKAVLALLNSSSWMVASRKAAQRDRKLHKSTWAHETDTGKKEDATTAGRGLQIQGWPRRDGVQSLDPLHRVAGRSGPLFAKLGSRTRSGTPQLPLSLVSAPGTISRQGREGCFPKAGVPKPDTG